MRYFALMIRCERCGRTFLAGGGAGNDISKWLRFDVECPQCKALLGAQDGATVPLAPEAVEAPGSWRHGSG